MLGENPVNKEAEVYQCRLYEKSKPCSRPLSELYMILRHNIAASKARFSLLNLLVQVVLPNPLVCLQEGRSDQVNIATRWTLEGVKLASGAAARNDSL